MASYNNDDYEPDHSMTDHVVYRAKGVVTRRLYILKQATGI